MVTQWPCLMPPIIQQVALFFLCTNVGYSVVVGFVTRSDQSSLTNWWSIQIMWDLKKESSIWVTIPRLNYLLLNKCFLRAKHSLLAFPDTYVIFIISKHGTKDHKHVSPVSKEKNFSSCWGTVLMFLQLIQPLHYLRIHLYACNDQIVAVRDQQYDNGGTTTDPWLNTAVV